MSESDHKPGDPGAGMTPKELAAGRMIRGLPEAEPRPEFRARLRREFVKGEVPASRSPGLRLLPWSPRLWALGAPAVIAAAALLLILLNPGPRWRVLYATGGGQISVDGAAVSLNEPGGLARLLHPGCRIRSGDSTLVMLACPGRLVVQILPGTNMTLPASPGRWMGRTIRATVESGELRITTNPDFHGARLLVDTPEVEATVTGTTLAVIRPDFGSCICVLEGTVRVGAHGGSPEPVGAGHRFTYLRAESRVDRGEMLSVERVQLSQLRQAYGRH